MNNAYKRTSTLEYLLLLSLRRLCFHRCLSVHEECLPHCMLGYTPPRIRGRHPPGRHPLPGQTTPWADSAYWDTVNKRAVRIPLECILVLLLNTQSNHTETVGYGYNKKSNVCRDNVMPIKDTPGFPKSKPQLPFKRLRNVFF